MKKLKELHLLTKLKSLKKWQKILLCTAVSLLCFTGWVIWGNISLQVTEYTITSHRLPESFDGFKIVQISDLHDAEFGEDNCRLLEKIHLAKPDIIVLTGDLVDSRRINIDLSLSFARQAVRIAPVYYVPGNHEKGVAYKTLYKGLQEAGVTLLLDKQIYLTRGEDQINLMGVLDPAFRSNDDIAPVLSKLMPKDAPFTLLLSHRPEYFDDYVAFGIDLALTGHLHGGQFRIPFLGGLYTPRAGFFPKYDAGLFTEDHTNMIVSRGLGNSRFPIRLNNRPEIVVVTLKKG